MTVETALGLHRDSIVIDAVSPLVMDDPQYLDWYREGGVTALAPTVGSVESARNVLDRLARWQRLLGERSDLLLIRRAADIELAKQSGRLGVYFHFQGTGPIEDNLDLIDLYKALGVGMVQLTYNVRNAVGDGCEEPGNAGLSRFGFKLVERLNEARVIVDCSHTGLYTSLDTIACSSAPVVLSHSNVKAVQDNPRNVTDELIEAIARSGGVIGIVGFPSMVANCSRPSLDQFITHIDAIVQRVGIDHVGLGIDYYQGQAGIATDEAALRGYEAALAAGLWTAAYPPPPHHYPRDLETPQKLATLTTRLIERGYDEEGVKKVLGLNWLRVMTAVWG